VSASPRAVLTAAAAAHATVSIVLPAIGPDLRTACALAEHAGWDVFWLTTTLLAAAGAAVAATLSPGTTRLAPLIPSLP
jgi:hypothetical protein